MKNKKRWISLALVGVMVFQTNAIGALAETAPENNQTAAVQEAVVTEIGSDVWDTPIIPGAAKYIKGVEKTEINLNETTGDGTWRYLYDIPDYTQPGGIAAPGTENQDFDFNKWADRDWNDIKVPGEPLMQGFDILSNNEYYYQREITVPDDFAGNRVKVRFDGVYSNSRIWINGTYVQTHVGGFTTWDCDITEYAAPGETVTMTVGVAELYSTTKGIWNPEGRSVNNPANASEYAHHNMGGINRDVSLVAIPYDSMAHTYVNTDFDETFTNANLEVTAQIQMLSGKAKLQVELLDGESLVTSGSIEYEREKDVVKNLPKLAEEAGILLEENADNLYEGNTGNVGQYSEAAYATMQKERQSALQVLADSVELSTAKKLTLPVEAPKQWDAEHPNLYTLRTTLLVDDKAVQVNEEKVGFREIHYGGAEGTDTNKVYVNGKEVKLRGTCRHDVSDDLGRSMTREESYAEIAAYKNANINHIRTSHYPASEDLLDACDEMGIYVEQETAVCFQGPWADVSSKYEDFLPQFTEMIERDRNRPSILIWSLGNESNYNKVASQSGGNAFQDERDYLRDVDTSRPCVFSFPDTGEPAGFVDIYSAHYASVTGNMGNSSKPVIHDEYAHISCYNLDELQRDVNVRNFWGESIKKGWENIFTSDGALGGALWGGIDDVFYIPEGTTERYQSHSDGQTAGYGEWGSVLDAYLREKPEAYLTKKAYSPVRVDDEACYITGGTMYIPVKNWFDHTNTNELKLIYTIDEVQKEMMVAESIAPHSDGVITISGVPQDADSVNLKFYTPDGIMVDEYNAAIASTQYSFTPASPQAPSITDSDQSIVVKGQDFSVTFNKENGMIVSGEFQDEVLVTGGPYLHVTGMGLGEWILAEEDGITVATEEEYAVITLNGAYGNGQGVRFDLRISGNGIITTDYTLTTAPKVSSGLREVGISYDISKDTDNVSWLRDGLYTAYPEDHIGRNKGVALKVRAGSEETPDQYGVEPQWPWKDDMKNYFVYSTDDPNNGLVTNDFKTMREHVWSYDVNYGLDEDAPRISVEAPEGNVAARVSITYDLGYVDDRDGAIKYKGDWGIFDSNSDYAGTETFSSTLGDSCEFTFTGTGVRYIGAKQKNTGLVKVYVDDVLKEEIDTYSNLGSDLKQAVIYSIEGLENGKHTIRLETAGGKANCIVVDAFEVLKPEGSTATEKAQLIINNQWYYPNLGWGNYYGIQGTLSNGKKGSSTIRLTNKNHLSEEVMTSLVNFKVSELNKDELKASYHVQNADEGTEVKLQWYRVAVGDPDSKAQAIEGANGEVLNSSGLEANKVYCMATLVIGGVDRQTVKSNAVEIGQESYRYYDILDDSDSFEFTGTLGTDYKTDKDKSWTANAYGKSVTYLMDTKNEAGISFKFVGSGIRWVGAKENNQGIAAVTIDEGTPMEIDLFDANSSTGNQVNEVLFEQVWEEQGEHEITIYRTGRRNPLSLASNVSLDAFIIINDGNEQVKISDAPVAEQEEVQTEFDLGENIETEASEVDNSMMDMTHAVKETNTPEENNEIMKLTGAVSEESFVKQTKEVREIDTAKIENAITKLTKAIADFKASRMEKAPVDKSKLSALINSMNGKYNEKLYTPESWNVFIQALNAAKSVQANDKAEQADVTRVIATLEAAVRGLKPVEIKPVPVDKTGLKNLYQSCTLLKKADYTASSWATFDAAMKNAAAVINNPNATKVMADQAMNTLSKAKSGLSKIPAMPKKGAAYKTKDLRYKVTASTSKTKTVMVVSPIKKTYKSLTIPNTVKINGYTYKVTSIADKAFRKNTKLAKVTIGSNVSKIGKESFMGCKALKSVVLKTSSVKSIGRDAFKNISERAKIYIPKRKYTSYKKMLVKAKISSKVRLIKR